MENNIVINPDNLKQYKRVNRCIAKRSFNAGRSLLLAPSKVPPFTLDLPPWYEKRAMDKKTDNDFHNMVHNFAYFNLSHATGYYTAFYLEI